MAIKHYQGDEFPVHIDLGKDPSAPIDLPAPTPPAKKSKPYYPTLYISDIPGLVDIPKEGCALIEFRRKSASVNTPDDGKESASVELEIRTLCLMEKDGGEEDIRPGLTRAAKDMGIDTGDEESTDEEDGE